MHFRFALQPGHAQAKSAAVGAYCLSQSLVSIENRAEAEGQHGAAAKANTHYSRMFQDMLLPELRTIAIVFADNYGEFSAGITQHGGSVHALNPFQEERAASARAI